MQSSTNVIAIIGNTDRGHLSDLLQQRNPGSSKAIGAAFTQPQTTETLQRAAWDRYDHTDIPTPLEGFQADIDGRVGVYHILDLYRLDENGMVTFVEDKGKFHVVYKSKQNIPTTVTMMIVGPDPEDAEDSDKRVIYDLYPGEPDAPTRLAVEAAQLAGYQAGNSISLIEAYQLYFEYAQIVYEV